MSYPNLKPYGINKSPEIWSAIQTDINTIRSQFQLPVYYSKNDEFVNLDTLGDVWYANFIRRQKDYDSIGDNGGDNFITFTAMSLILPLDKNSTRPFLIKYNDNGVTRYNIFYYVQTVSPPWVGADYSTIKNNSKKMWNTLLSDNYYSINSYLTYRSDVTYNTNSISCVRPDSNYNASTDKPWSGNVNYSTSAEPFIKALIKVYPELANKYYYYLSNINWTGFFSSYCNDDYGYSLELYTNIPIFDNYESAVKWLVGGDRSGELIEIPPCDYTLFIDGDRLPNYNLNWNPDGLGKYGENSLVNIEFRAKPINPLNLGTTYFYNETVPYTDGFFKFNWSEVWQKLDVKIAIIEEVLTNEFTVVIHSLTKVNGEIKHQDNVSVNLFEKKKLNGDLYSDLVSPSNTGDTLTIDFGEGKDSDDYYDTDSGENDEHSPTVGYDIGACNLTACYELSVERLNNIAIKLWSEDFFSNILLLNNSPIENILSCKLLPLSLSGNESAVKIGNVDMGINGNRLSNTVYRYNIGTIAIARINNMGFLNYAPYTSITIFLPFIGFKTLNASDIMGRNLSVDYVVDVITGACKAIITVDKYQCYEFDGNCGIDIPLSAGNRSEVEMGYAQAAASAVTSTELGLVGGVIGAHVSGASQQYHYDTTGTYSPATGAYEDRTCFIIIDRPQYTEVSKFGHTKGYKCQLTKTIGSLKGFVKTTENVDLSNISAPEYCKKKILDLLSSGIYV